PFEQQADDPLPIRRRGRRRLPQRREILRERPNGLPFLSRERRWMRLAEASVLLFHLLKSLEFCFPAALQFAGDEAIFRFDDAVLPLRSLGLITSAFHTLPPVVVEALSFLLQFTRGAEAQFQRGRLQRAQDL